MSKLPLKEMKLSEFQKFQVQRLKRTDLKAAPYNPRKIDKHNRQKLKSKLEKAGLVMPIVWNKTTGNIVSGHQRIEILEELEGSQEYELDVAMVEVDEKTEKELNIFLNNQSAMGTWDLDALTDIFKNVPDISELGFDPLDIQMLSQDDSMSTMFDESKRGGATQTETDIAKIKASRKNYKEKKREDDNTQFYAVLVFKNHQECEAFARALNEPEQTQYFDGRRIAEDFGIPLDKFLADRKPETV
jgi:hypothetical protein